MTTEGLARTPWRRGIATGVGSLPGTDPVEAAALIAGELPDLVHLAELPARGPGADMVGRAAAILVDISSEVVPTGWRLTRRPGGDVRRARDYLAFDLDAAGDAYAGAPWVKLQVCGPWTLAAEVELPSGHRVLTDAGAVDDVAASLAEGVLAQADELARRLPGSGVVVQIDEPQLPAVLAGTLPTASGFGTVRAVEPSRAATVLAELVRALDGRPSVVHCCHPHAPVALLRAAGFDALSLDVTRIPGTAAHLDAIGEALEAGAVLLAGLVATTAPADREPSLRETAAPLLDLWSRLGLSRAELAGVVPTPTCGLAGAGAALVRKALHTCAELGRALTDPPDGW